MALRRSQPTKAQIPAIGPVLRAVEAVLVKGAEDEARKFMERQVQAFRLRILHQRFRSFVAIFYPESGTNLSPRWLRRKELANADPRTMIATGHYVSKIRVFSRKHGKGRQLRIGFHHSDRARNLEGLPVPFKLDALAKTHEFGSQKQSIPARPHWRPYRDNVFSLEARKFRKQVWPNLVPKLRARLKGRAEVTL